MFGLTQLEKLYPRLPIPVQQFGLGVYGWLYRRERLGGAFEEYVSGFRERDRWSPAEMAEYVTESLQQRLLHAFEDVPYYRERWTKAGIRPSKLLDIGPADLGRLPVTPKHHLNRDPRSMVAEGVAKRQRLVRYYSSGSTGTPLTCYYTRDAHRRFIAAREVRSFGWAGASIRMPRSMMGGRIIIAKPDAAPPYYRYNFAERQLYCSAYHLRSEAAPSYLEGFHRYRPQLFTGYAYSHFLLAQMLLERDLRLDYEPKALVLGSEKLTPRMKTALLQVFRARAYEEYGAVENCVLATECEKGRLHVNQDFGLVEIVGEEDESLPPGKVGRILCTGLLNEAQPLIRYEIGDLGSWSAERCPCGRTQLPVLQEIAGRLEDVVVSPDGKKMVRFHGVFINLPNVLQGQVIQEQLDVIRIRLITLPEFGLEEEELIRERVRRQLGNVRVIVEPGAELERSRRGKFKAVISRISP